MNIPIVYLCIIIAGTFIVVVVAIMLYRFILKKLQEEYTKNATLEKENISFEIRLQIRADVMQALYMRSNSVRQLNSYLWELETDEWKKFEKLPKSDVKEIQDFVSSFYETVFKKRFQELSSDSQAFTELVSMDASWFDFEEFTKGFPLFQKKSFLILSDAIANATDYSLLHEIVSKIKSNKAFDFLQEELELLIQQKALELSKQNLEWNKSELRKELEILEAPENTSQRAYQIVCNSVEIMKRKLLAEDAMKKLKEDYRYLFEQTVSMFHAKSTDIAFAKTHLELLELSEKMYPAPEPVAAT